MNSDKRISEENEKTLNYIKGLGIKISFCTGRLFSSARGYAKHLGGGIYIISCNGAYITDEEYNEIAAHPMDFKESEVIIDICRKYDAYFHFFDRERIYSEKESYGRSVYLKGTDQLADEDKTEFVVRSDLKETLRSGVDVFKYIIMDDDPDKIKRIRRELEPLDLEVSSSLSNNIEITAAGINKGSGLIQLLKFLGIGSDEVIAMGDSENDISMLKTAGLGVAMGNGRNDVKTISDYVTAIEDDDGVAQALRHFLVEGSYGDSRR